MAGECSYLASVAAWYYIILYLLLTNMDIYIYLSLSLFLYLQVIYLQVLSLFLYLQVISLQVISTGSISKRIITVRYKAMSHCGVL
jgi:hypothetical protein